MTTQEAFNTVWQHFVVEKNPPATFITDDGRVRCRYRDSDGNRCAAGVLIPDHLFNELMEGQSISSLLYGYPEVRRLLHEVPPHFLARLQGCHDSVAIALSGLEVDRQIFTQRIETALQKLADEYALEVPA